jgi:hypothetical protein
MGVRGSKPGERRGGRKKGTPNKATKAVKEALLEALNDGAGATAFFLEMKNSKVQAERIAFANICAKLIPAELTGKDGIPLIPKQEEHNRLDIARRIAFILTSAVDKDR